MVIFLYYELEIKKCNDNLFHVFKKMYLNDGSIVCVQLRINNMYNSSFIVNILIHEKFKSKGLIEFRISKIFAICIRIPHFLMFLLFPNALGALVLALYTMSRRL